MSLIKRSKGEKLFEVINLLIMLFMAVVTLYPFWYVICASVSESNAFIAKAGLIWKPLNFTLMNYKRVVQNDMIWVGYRNTIFISFTAVALDLIFNAAGAFFWSRKGMMLKGPIILLFMIPMYFSGGLIPTYLNIKNLGLLDSRLALILPGLASTYTMLIMKSAFLSIPNSLIESAELDGANPLRILLQIVIPLSMATMAVMALFGVVGNWNGWMSAMIYLNDRKKFPLQLFLREILIQNDTSSMTKEGERMLEDKAAINETLQYATTMVATLPLLVVYPFLQKYFAKGMMIGSVKE